MKENVKPSLPPALRKARKPEEISNAFPPIIARPRPEPPPPAVIAPAPVVVAPAPTLEAPVVPVPSPAALKPASSPTVKPTSAPAPVAPPAPQLPKTRPKPVFTGRSPIAQLEGREVLFEGVFVFEGNPPFVVETKLTGNGANDKKSIIAKARKIHPTGALSLKSTRIYSREVGAISTFRPGTTLSQLFGEAGSPTEVTVCVGNVFFDGTRCQIYLRNLRSRNSVTLSLRQPTGGNVNFSNQLQANRLANELPLIVKEVLGTNVRELVITLKEEKPA